MFRTLAWNEDMGALAPYTLSPGPEVGAWLEAYPAAFATDGFAANIGLYGSFNYGIGAQSKLPSGMMLTTKYQDFLAGVKVRIPVGMIIPTWPPRTACRSSTSSRRTPPEPGRTSTTRSSARVPARAPSSRRPSIWIWAPAT